MENVMLNAIQNQIKIVDFGLSNEWTSESPLKTHCGSPEYAAPELFVTSKVYGPEVDLWSLGIILYGMVVGQLPFVSAKSPSITSQERRKLLVAQINKGISTPQRKALTSFSFEFRNLMNRLLTADSNKRINIKEMIVHPWITECGRRFVRANPARKITTVIHNKIINEIGAVSNMHPGEVNKKVKEEPFGKAGGMYNILVHRSAIKPFTPDLVTRSLSDTITFHLGRKKEKEKPEIPQRQVQTARAEGDRNIRPILRRHSISTASSDMSKTKTILSTKIPQFHPSHSTSQGKSSSNAVAEHSRPLSVQIRKKHDDGQDRRPVTSALHKRQEYSAAIASRFSQLSTPKSVKSKRSDKDEEQVTNLKRRLEYLHRIVPSRGQESHSKHVSKTSDSNIPRKSPRTPVTPRRKSSNDRSSPSKTTNSTVKAHRSPSPKNNLPPLNAFMKFIAPHGDILERKIVDISRSKSPKRASQKSGVSRYSDTPIEPRKSPARVKLRTKRPVSCQNNVERVTPISRRISVVPVSEKRSIQPSLVTSMRPGRCFMGAISGLCNLGGRGSKNIYSIPPNRYELVEEPQPGSARGDYEPRNQTTSPSTTRRSAPAPKPDFGRPGFTKISKNILNYLQRSQFRQ